MGDRKIQDQPSTVLGARTHDPSHYLQQARPSYGGGKEVQRSQLPGPGPHSWNRSNGRNNNSEHVLGKC